MATLPDLAVTGSTGALGALVARDLADRGVAQRLLVRDAGRAPTLPGATPVVFASYADHASSVEALRGVSTLLMVSASESATRLDEHRAFVDAAAEAGVGHVVYTSFLGAAPVCTFTLGRDHWATEEHVRASVMEFTFLRDNFYLDFLPLMAGADGVIRGPAGEGRLSAVARADIARVAATVLIDPDAHRDHSYDLTGPEAFTLTEAAAVLAELTGGPISYVDETLEEAYASRRRDWPAPEWQYDAWVSTYTAIAADEVSRITGDVEALTGRRPRSLRDLLADG